MTNSIGEGDARSALSTVEYSRRQVIAEIDMPRWYWLGLAAGWIGLGLDRRRRPRLDGCDCDDGIRCRPRRRGAERAVGQEAIGVR